MQGVGEGAQKQIQLRSSLAAASQWEQGQRRNVLGPDVGLHLCLHLPHDSGDLGPGAGGQGQRSWLHPPFWHMGLDAGVEGGRPGPEADPALLLHRGGEQGWRRSKLGPDTGFCPCPLLP